jgi:pilus assembly protein FimV
LQREEADASGEVDHDDANAFAAGLAAAGAATAVGAEDEPREALSSQAEGEEDTIAEADFYIAYGRLDQAAQVLESAISREPSRSDLRLKLLEVYADGGNEDAFGLQMSELEALDDEAAILQAESLRERLAAEADAPSIDDLETQLRADVGRGEEEGAVQEETDPEEDDLGITWSLDDPAEPVQGTEERAEEEALSSDFDFDFDTESDNETKAEGAISGIDFSLDDLDLDDDSNLDKDATSADADDLTPEAVAEEEGDDSLDFNLDDDDLESVLGDDGALTDDGTLNDNTVAEVDDKGVELSNDELDALDLGDEPESSAAGSVSSAAIAEDAPADTESDTPESDAEAGAGRGETASERDEAGADTGTVFDDSFLEELDAELDKVGEENAEESAPSTPGDAELNDLELDVTDEDLALIEEVAGGEEDETVEGKDPVDAEADDLLDLDLDEGDDLSAEAGEVPTVDSWSETGEQDDASGDVPRLDNAEESVEADTTDDFDDSLLEESSGAMADFSEGDLGDEDDFDFLEGTDEAATKLDLARAYVEMGDAEGARDILEEVSLEGSDVQKQDAQALLRKLA